jgi:outer membrane receptor protein involved in Fe transport
MIVSALASALALAAPDAAVRPTPGAAPTAGVISYQPEFFAAAQPANAEEMLMRLPGFTLDLGADVRGFEGAAGNVLIDGQRPVSKTDSLEEILRRIPASQVARIDLIRGGAPGIDMQGKSILANVVRKPSSGFRGLAALSGRSIYDGRGNISGRLELSGGKDDRTWEAAAVVGMGVDDGAGEGPRVRVGPDGVPLRIAEVDSEGDTLQQTLTAAYSAPLLGGQAKVNARLFNDNYKFDESNTFSFPAPSFETTIEHYDEFQTELGGSFLRNFGSKTSLELIALRQDAQIDIAQDFAAPDDMASFTLDRRTSETIGRAVLKHRLSDRLSFEAGAEGALNVLKSETGYVENGAAVELPAANVRVEERRGEGFLRATWRPNPVWTLEGGLRYEASAIESSGDVALEKTLTYAKPRLALTWAPTASTQFRLRLERVVDQLDFDDFVADSSLNTGVVTAGNPDLVPEQAWVSEAAIEQRFPGGAVISLTVRRSAIDDVIDRAPVFLPTGVFDAPNNIGDGTKDELLVNANLPLAPLGLKGVTIRGEATWRRSEVTDPTTGQAREISGLRPIEWEAHFTHDLPAYRFNWGVDVFGGWRETYYRYNEISTSKLKTYVVPFVEWKPSPDVILRAEIQNVTSRGFRNTRVVYSGPRDTSPIAFTDDRDIQFGPMYWFRIRKTLGS